MLTEEEKSIAVLMERSLAMGRIMRIERQSATSKKSFVALLFRRLKNLEGIAVLLRKTASS
jgi:hypothetical protein